MKQSLERGVYGNLTPAEIKSKQLQNTERLKKGALGDLSEDEIEARRHETIDQLHGKQSLRIVEDVLEEDMQEKSINDLVRGFEMDADDIRRCINEYHSYQDMRLRELKGQEILKQSDDIVSEIEEQIKLRKDPFEKADLDKVRIELNKIVKNIPRTLEKAA